MKNCETFSIFDDGNIKNEAILRDFLQKWKAECRADGLVPMRFAIFPLHLSKVLCLPRKCCTCHQNHLAKTDDLLQNSTPLRKSAPEPPNISDEHVSCTVPATRKTSLQILRKSLTPATIFRNAAKPSRFAHFWQGDARGRIPCACHAKPHLNLPKWSGHVVLLYTLRLKCASRHNGVRFFDISTSNSGPSMRCF